MTVRGKGRAESIEVDQYQVRLTQLGLPAANDNFSKRANKAQFTQLVAAARPIKQANARSETAPPLDVTTHQNSVMDGDIIADSEEEELLQ
jgi:hypothetical protein